MNGWMDGWMNEWMNTSEIPFCSFYMLSALEEHLISVVVCSQSMNICYWWWWSVTWGQPSQHCHIINNSHWCTRFKWSQFLEQLFLALEYGSSTQIFVYLGLADGVCHGVNAYFVFLFFFYTFPPVLSSSTFQDIWSKLFSTGQLKYYENHLVSLL